MKQQLKKDLIALTLIITLSGGIETTSATANQTDKLLIKAGTTKASHQPRIEYDVVMPEEEISRELIKKKTM